MSNLEDEMANVGKQLLVGITIGFFMGVITTTTAFVFCVKVLT